MKKNLQILLSALCFCAFLNKATAQFSGDGTENNPYIITTAQQLAQLATYVNDGNANYNNKCYKLGNDIDLSAYQSGKGWIPIGKDYVSGKSFGGVFDGNSKKITGLYINNPDLDYAGLFGYIFGGIIKNLGVVNVNINANSDVGGIVGKALSNVTTQNSLKNCYSTGKVIGNGKDKDRVGGIVGNFTGVIQHCYSNCQVSGNENVGGIVGFLILSSFVGDSYATGDINGNSSVGGVVGHASTSSIIEYCVALNPCVKGIGLNIGRVVGGVGGSGCKLTSNAAWNGIINNAGNTTWNYNMSNQIDGEDMTLQTIKTDGSLGGRFTSANGWTIQNGKLPGLFGKPVEMPAHLGGVGIDELQVTSYELQVYPNPTTGELRVTSDELQVTSMEIFDVYGRAVSTHYSLLTTHCSMDISHLPAGIYFLKIETEKGPVVKKVVKQ